jgi:hypothetical protein
MALLSFADSAPRAYRLKVGNAYLTFSTSSGTSPRRIPHKAKRIVPLALRDMNLTVYRRAPSSLHGVIAEIDTWRVAA